MSVRFAAFASDTARWIVRQTRRLQQDVAHLRTQSTRSWRDKHPPYPPIEYRLAEILHSPADGGDSMGPDEIGRGRAGSATDVFDTLELSQDNVRGDERASRCERLPAAAAGDPCVRLSRGTWDAELYLHLDRVFADSRSAASEETSESARALANRLQLWDLYTFAHIMYLRSWAGDTSGLVETATSPVDGEGYWDHYAAGWFGGESGHFHLTMFRNPTELVGAVNVFAAAGPISWTQPIVAAWTKTVPVFCDGDAGEGVADYAGLTPVGVRHRFRIAAERNDWYLGLQAATAYRPNLFNVWGRSATVDLDRSSLFLRKCSARV